MIISSGKLEGKQQILAKWECNARSSVYFYKRSLKSGSLSEIPKYFSVDNKIIYSKTSMSFICTHITAVCFDFEPLLWKSTFFC